MFSRENKRISHEQIDNVCREVYPETDSQILKACMQDGRMPLGLAENIEKKLDSIIALQRNINDGIIEEDRFSQKSANKGKKDVFWDLFVGYQMVQSHTYATGVLRCEKAILSKEENKEKLRQLFALQKALFDFALKHPHAKYFDWSTEAIKKNWEEHITNDPYFFPQNVENKRTLQLLEAKLEIPAEDSLMAVISKIEESKKAPAAATRKRKADKPTTAAAIRLLLEAASSAEKFLPDPMEQEYKRLREENASLKKELAKLQERNELLERGATGVSPGPVPFQTPKTLPRSGNGASSPFFLGEGFPGGDCFEDTPSKNLT